MDPTRRDELRFIAEAAEGEDDQVEFTHLDPNKNSSWSAVVKDIVAIANHKGGAVVFDCDDDGAPDPGPPRPGSDQDIGEVTRRIARYTGHTLDVIKVGVKRQGRDRIALLVDRCHEVVVFSRDADVDVGSVDSPRFYPGQVVIRRSGESGWARTSDLNREIQSRADLKFQELVALLNAGAKPTGSSVDASGPPSIELPSTLPSKDNIEQIHGPTQNDSTARPPDRAPG